MKNLPPGVENVCRMIQQQPKYTSWLGTLDIAGLLYEQHSGGLYIYSHLFELVNQVEKDRPRVV
jgi:hypothetical protein